MDLNTWVPAPGPVRRFAVVNLINTVGTGIYLASSALFFTRTLGHSVDVVATVLALGMGCGLLLSPFVGRIADRSGARQVYASLLVLQGACLALLPCGGAVWTFTLLAVVSAIADRGIAAVVGAFVHDLSDGCDRILARAQLRTTTNLGVGIGAVIASVAFLGGDDRELRILIWTTAVVFLLCGVLVHRMDCTRSVGEARPKRGTAVWRDRRYLLATLTNGWLSLHVGALTFALPLWVINVTAAPTWTAPAILVLNTVLVIVLQSPFARMAGDREGARRSSLLSGLTLGAAFALLPFSSLIGAVPAVMLLALWAVLLTVGELLQAGSGFFAAFELAPAEAQGEYQSVFALGSGVTRMCAPLLFAPLVVGPSIGGWLAVGASLVVAGVVHAWTLGDARTGGEP